MASFSPYALWKLAMRGISRDDVELVLADPEDGFISESSGRPCLVRDVDGRRIHVVLEIDDPEQVVTAYVPEPE